MSVKFPEIDYPRGRLPRGGSDIWDTPQASVVLADDIFAVAGPSPTVLTGSNVVSTATSTQGAIVQTNVVTGNSARQDNTSSSGVVTQLHTVAGNSVAQGTTSSVSAVSQNHVLSGASVVQPNASTAGNVTIPTGAIVLAGNSCRTDHTSSAGASIQEHLLAGNSTRADSSCTAGGVGQDHILVGNGVAVDHIAAASTIVQTHILAGANCVSFNEVASFNEVLVLGIVTRPSAQFMQDTLSTVFQTDQRAIAMEN